jgi:hypothetical protein
MPAHQLGEDLLAARAGEFRRERESISRVALKGPRIGISSGGARTDAYRRFPSLAVTPPCGFLRS